MSRITARKHAFALIYSLGFVESPDVEKTSGEYFAENKLNGDDIEFVLDEYRGVIHNLKDIDGLIGKCLKGWKLNRLNTVDMAILRLAVFEILYMEDIPASVSINEAVELSKEYSSDEAPAFINGVLGSVMKELRRDAANSE